MIFIGFHYSRRVFTYVLTVLLRLVASRPSPRKNLPACTACHCSPLLIMLVRDKLCFVLSTSWRTAGRSSTPRLATTTTTTTIAGTTRTTPAFSTQTATRMSALGTWPSPQAFNALPVSARSKAYCDYGDEGKMAWKPHEEPLKVGSGDLANGSLATAFVGLVLTSSTPARSWSHLRSDCLCPCACILLWRLNYSTAVK